jgi:hypothetical protein
MPSPRPTTSGGGIVCDGDRYVFENLEVGTGRYEHIALNTALLDSGNKRNQTQWWDYAKTSDEVLPNGVIYQMMHRIYSLRNDAGMQDVCNGALQVLREDWATHYPHTGTRIEYGAGLEATIQHLQPDKSIVPVTLGVPAFTRHDDKWSYVTLAAEQAESKLGTMSTLPTGALPFMAALLGSHAEEAGAVCQYVSTRKSGKLREARLWVPMAANRNDVRALVLGVSFNVYANDGINGEGPARGVAVRENFP